MKSTCQIENLLVCPLLVFFFLFCYIFLLFIQNIISCITVFFKMKSILCSLFGIFWLLLVHSELT